MYLSILPLADGLLHWLECISGQLGGQDEFLVNVFDLLHHIRLELREGFLELHGAFHGLRRSVDMFVSCKFAGDGFVDAVQALGACELVVEDVGPGIAPLCGGFLDLKGSVGQLSDGGCDGVHCLLPLCRVVEWLEEAATPLRRSHTYDDTPPAGPGGLYGLSGATCTHILQHLVAVIEVAQHGLDVGLVGGPRHEGQTPKLPLHSLHGEGGLQADAMRRWERAEGANERMWSGQSGRGRCSS